MNLALFDFDGTVTHTDSFTKFIFLTVDKSRLRMGKVLLSPYVIGYKLGIIAGSHIRPKIFNFGFKNRQLAEVEQLAQAYASDVLPTLLRPSAMDKVNWHKAQGDEVVIVSASLNLYLKPWCAEHGLALLCSEVESVNGVITGHYIDNGQGGDCSAKVKVNKIRANYDLTKFDKIYAYGDTPEDKDMLALADEAFYQYF